MNVNVIRTQDIDMASKILLSGLPDQNTLNNIQQSYNNFRTALGNHASNFMESVKKTYDYVQNVNIIDRVKRVLTNNNAITGDDVIYIVNMDNYETAGYMIRRYIMANPIIYDKYKDFKVDGYGDDWYDPEPHVEDPKWRTDYLNATHGIMQFDGNGNGYVNFNSTSDGNDLSLTDRFNINNTWDILNSMLANGVDPTKV